jgi:hypothetical protein
LRVLLVWAQPASLGGPSIAEVVRCDNSRNAGSLIQINIASAERPFHSSFDH